MLRLACLSIIGHIQRSFSLSTLADAQLGPSKENTRKMSLEKGANPDFNCIEIGSVKINEMESESLRLNKTAPKVWEFVISQPKNGLGCKLANDKDCCDRFKKVLQNALLYWGNGNLALKSLWNFSHIELILEILVTSNSSYSKKIQIKSIVGNIKSNNPIYVQKVDSSFIFANKHAVFEMLDAMCDKFCRLADSISEEGFESMWHKKKYENFQAQALLELNARGSSFIPPSFENAYKFLTKEEKKQAYRTVLEQLKKRAYKCNRSIIDSYVQKVSDVEFRLFRKSYKLLVAAKSNDTEQFDKFFDNFIKYLKSFNILESYEY